MHSSYPITHIDLGVMSLQLGVVQYAPHALDFRITSTVTMSRY